jgi:hypothetical protein
MPSIATVIVLTGSFMTPIPKLETKVPSDLFDQYRGLYVTAIGAPRGAADASVVMLSFSF